jgi:hypothetical protein
MNDQTRRYFYMFLFAGAFVLWALAAWAILHRVDMTH